VKSTSPDLAALRESIATHIDQTDAEFGVCIRHVESDAEISINPDALYPMASVFKIPVLLETLAQVDEGRTTLQKRIELRQEDKVLPSGILVELDPGLRPTLHDLLTLMIIISDNTATDLVLAEIGLPAVEQRMRGWGFDSISVKMGVQDIFDHTFPRVDVALTPADRARAVGEGERNWDAVTGRRTLENNVASPREMGRLLVRLQSGDLLSAASTRAALDILLRQQLNQRLPRFLPPQVPFAHKTGTLLQSRNDAGVITLPDGTHLVVVTFALLRRDLIEADPAVAASYADRVDAAMGLIARDAYETFSATGRS
jgi:beta-lactamase class A